MKFYLSSFKLGNDPEDLVKLMPDDNKKIGYIPNALDFIDPDSDERKEWENEDIKSLQDLGLEVEYLDLKDYFGKRSELRNKLNELGGVFVRGGNTFILRQAMGLSGFDRLFNELLKKDDFVYSGYSAGICILAPDLKALQNVDSPSEKPYDKQKETIWEGLGYLDYIILPHYKSNHSETEYIDKEVEYCEENNIPYKTLRDGEVIVIT